MNIREATDALVNYVRSSGKGQSEAINILWNRRLKKLDSESREQLAKEGLRWRVGHALTNGIPESAVEVGPVAGETVVHLSVEPQEIQEQILHFVCYTVADGTARPLLHLRIDDFQFLIQQNRQQIEGLEEKSNAFQEGINLLREHHVQEIADLPEQVRNQYADRWEEITASKRKSAAA